METAKIPVAVLGATGSVGRATFAVMRRFRESFGLAGLHFHSNLELARKLHAEFRAECVLCTAPDISFEVLRHSFPGARVIQGADEPAWSEFFGGIPASSAVIHAVVGAAGLVPTKLCLERGLHLAIANKESLVAAGPLLPVWQATGGGRMVPVDSEHNALFQLLEWTKRAAVDELILTTSGGPFRLWSAERMAEATVEQALDHPTWKMGPKITIDSATLVNKSLELLEAHYLFGIELDRIKIVAHPQSQVHGALRLVEGGFLAYASRPAMEYPVAHAMFYPRSVPAAVFEERQSVDELYGQSWNFEAPDLKKYPAIALAYEAGRIGGTAPAVFNAANETFVDAFLERRIRFGQIVEGIAEVLGTADIEPLRGIESCFAAEKSARAAAAKWLASK